MVLGQCTTQTIYYIKRIKTMRIKFIIQVYSATLFIFLLLSVAAFGQSISSFLPARITKSEKYLFYLHGGVVTILGNNAINQSMPEWGHYEYLNILDSLQSRGFTIINN